MDLNDQRGIDSILHVYLYLNEQENSLLNLRDSKTYIEYEKYEPLLISDPEGFFSDVSFEIIPVDASNFVLKYDIGFNSTMGLSDMLLYMWNTDRYIAQKFFENAIEVAPTESTLHETKDEFEKEVNKIIMDTKKPTVPDWLKNNVSGWAQGKLEGTTFTNAIKFLIQEKIIDIDVLPNISRDPDSEDEELEEEETIHIPKWIKNNAKWWADDLLTEEDFLNGIKYLVEKEIIRT